jgi:glycosyltransferase involved in cell wall biosynthesis
MKITIFTIVRNDIRNIEKTIKSVINQDYNNIEYIIIDGASEDGTIDIINKYIGKISFLISEPDSGIYNAMNKALKYSTGDLIGLVNSGDILLPNTLRKVFDIAVNQQTKFYAITGGVEKIDINYEHKYIVNRKYSDILKMHIRMPLNHGGTFISKEALNKCGYYNENLLIVSDYDYILRLIKNNVEIIFSNYIFYQMLENGISDQSIIKHKRLREEYYVRKNHFGKIPAILIISRIIIFDLFKKLIPDRILKIRNKKYE